MANGTPVIAFGCGSVPEIIEDGVTGFIVDDVDAAAAAAPLAKQLDRRAIRKRFEERFTAERMARDYLTLYQRVLLGGTEAVEERVLDDTEAIEPKLLTFAAREGLAQAAE
jgi:glycosyltransferase involved in cell wall biosynthesis